MKISLVFIISIFVQYPASSQQRVAHYDEEPFALQVKQVDEFIERFNNADDALIKKYLGDRYDIKLSREELILSLFDRSDFTELEKKNAYRFTQEILNEESPPYLSFYDSNWYAKLNCHGNYKDKPMTFTMVMEIRLGDDKQSVNWAVRSLDLPSMQLRGDFDHSMLLPPSTHGTKFQELHRVFASPKKYHDDLQTGENPLNHLLHLAEKGEFEFGNVSSVSYHFLQLSRWILEVEEYHRRSDNSGWLISNLYRADAQTKEEYLYKELYIH